MRAGCRPIRPPLTVAFRPALTLALSQRERGQAVSPHPDPLPERGDTMPARPPAVVPPSRAEPVLSRSEGKGARGLGPTRLDKQGDGLGEGFGGLGPVLVLSPLQAEIAHLAFDPARHPASPAAHHALLQDLVQYRLMQGEPGRRGEVKQTAAACAGPRALRAGRRAGPGLHLP